VVFLYSGHGLLDLGAYDAFLRGDIGDYELPGDAVEEALKSCPQV
jgi:tryptophan synthase beta chain